MNCSTELDLDVTTDKHQLPNSPSHSSLPLWPRHQITSSSDAHSCCVLSTRTDLPISVAFCLQSLFTGSIVVIYSEADFEVFRPAGATRCTDGGETWHGGALLRAKFHHHRCNDKGIGPPKLKFLLRFYQNVEHINALKFAEFVHRLRMC